MSKPTTDPIEWCRQESSRFAQMQGDKNNTNQRRKSFRFRNHMLAKIADRLEEAEATINKVHELLEEWRRYENAYPMVEAAYMVLANELQAILEQQANDDI